MSASLRRLGLCALLFSGVVFHPCSVKAEPETKGTPAVKVTPKAKPETKIESKSEVKPEAKPDAKPGVKTEVKNVLVPEVKPEVKNIPEVITNPGGKSVPEALIPEKKSLANSKHTNKGENGFVLEYKIPCLTVLSDETGGKFNYIPMKFIREKTDKPLRVAITDDTPGGSGQEIHSSVWMAAVTAAMLRNDTMHGVTIAIEFSGNVDGPSAGGVTCLAILSAMDGLELPEDFAMTGTIMPDGTIGLVGGVPEKIRAAAKAGAKRVFVPDFSRMFKDHKDQDVDIVRLAEDLKIELYQVTNIAEVYAILHKKPYQGDEYVNVRNMTMLPRNVEDTLKAVYINLNAKVAEKIKAKPDAVEEYIIDRDYVLSPNLARKYYSEGKFLPATWQIFLTWQTWQAWEQEKAFINDFFEKYNYRLGGIDYLREYHLRKMLDSMQKEINEKSEVLFSDAQKNHNDYVKKHYKKLDTEKLQGYFPFADGFTEITAQLEPVEKSSILQAYVQMAVYNRLSEDEREVAPEKELENSYYNECRLLDILFLLTLDESSMEDFLTKFGTTFPKMKPNKRAPEVESLFFAASMSVKKGMDINVKDFLDYMRKADKAQTASLKLRNDITLNCAIEMMDYAYSVHAYLLPDAKETASDISYHSQASLKAQVAAFSWNSAALVKYNFPTEEQMSYLMRNARRTAIRNINECVKANVPCLAPILDFETAETCNRTDTYWALVSYWKAGLYAKALLMSFQQL